MSYGLEQHSLSYLREMGKEMGLPSRRSKDQMISDIETAFTEYESYHKNKVDKYKRIKQLGHKGQQGITYLVVDEKGQEFAMKTFRKSKSSAMLKKEYKLQKKAGKAGVSPRVYEYDTVSKYIVMDIMDGHLLDVMKSQKGTLRRYQQKRILEIFRILDEIGVFHGDANLANYMLKGKDIYMIDYGFGKEIDSRLCHKLGTETPNQALMLLGLVLKLKEFDCPPSSYKYLLPHIPEGDQIKFGLKEKTHT